VRIPRIFTDQPLSEGREVTLNAQASRHLVAVLRFDVGDKIILFNGKGGQYDAHLLVQNPKKTVVLTHQYTLGIPPPSLAVTLGVALARADRMDWLVQKAVELGVAKIIPLFSARCEIKLSGDRAGKKVRHWQEIALSACEQCGQNLPPHIVHPTALQQVSQISSTIKFILDPLAECSLTSRVESYTGQPPPTVLILSGPEGGFTVDEVAEVGKQHTWPVTLGPRILRAETAPLVALSLLQALWGDGR
jgi:16S rRNA (uracil1498-N3)-methyltransferase